MRLPVPGPRDLLSVLERGAGSVEQLLAAVPRLLALVGDAEQLLARVHRLVDDIGGTITSADDVVARANQVVDRADTTISRTDGVVQGAEATIRRTDLVLTDVSPLNNRLAVLLDSLEPALSKLQPTLERLAESTSPAEVDAMVKLVDQLPQLADNFETDIMPILASLNNVSPDVHDLLDGVRELNQMLSQIPGLSRVKARIERRQEEEGRG